jgi:hypothetical protein
VLPGGVGDEPEGDEVTDVDVTEAIDRILNQNNCGARATEIKYKATMALLRRN